MLTAAIVLLDQITKIIVVRTIPLYYQTGFTIDVVGDVVRLIHARNPGVAFSVGAGLPDAVRRLLFVAAPIIVLFVLYRWYYRAPETTPLQRWTIALIFGGGIGNLIDRIFRPAGVVDFLDVKFYGLFGLERWPTFNVADSAIVVGSLALVVAMWTTPLAPPASDRQEES